MFVIKDLCLSILSMFQVNLHNLRRRTSVSDRFQTDPTEFNNTGMLTSLFTNIYIAHVYLLLPILISTSVCIFSKPCTCRIVMLSSLLKNV